MTLPIRSAPLFNLQGRAVCPLACLRLLGGGIAGFCFVLSSGVFGSSFATLWIFIYEYRKAKREIFSEIFQEVTGIFEYETLPLYEVLVSAPAMEDGYIFRYFKEFRTNYDYSAKEVYPLVCDLDRAIHGPDGEVKYDWQRRNPNLGAHMHETMWIFRDAFFPHRYPGENGARRSALS